MDHFIAALDNRELELKVRDRDPSDLEAAFRTAIRVEIHLKAYNADHDRESARDVRNRRERFEDNRVRQIAREPEPMLNRRAEANDENLTRMLVQLEHSQRENDELSKELGRLRLLADHAKTVAPAASVVEPQIEVSVAQPNRQFRNQPPVAARRDWMDDRVCF
jgi:hypothetical protein